MRNVEKIINRIRQKWISRSFHEDSEDWITINGTHVMVDEGTSEIKKGPERLKRSSGRSLASFLGVKKTLGDRSTLVTAALNNGTRKYPMLKEVVSGLELAGNEHDYVERPTIFAGSFRIAA